MKNASAPKGNFFKFILSNINDAVFLTELDGTFLYVCPNVDIIFGYTSKEVERFGNISKLISKNVFSMDELQLKGDLQNIEWNVPDKYATVHTVLANVRPVPYEDRDTILYVLRDITNSKQLEKDLRAYQRIVSSTDDFISLIDGNYRYRIVNSAYSRRTQEPTDLILGRTVAEVLGEGVFRELVKEKLDRCLRGETIRYQAWFEFPEASARFLDMTYMPYVENDVICGVVVNGRDITDLKQAEIALMATNRELHTRGRIADLFLTRPGDQVFAEILDLLLEEMDSQFGYFGYMDDQGSLICPSMTRGIWDQCRIPDKHIVFPRDCWGGLWGKSLQEKISLRQNEHLDLPQGHLLLQNALVVPLILEKKLVGQIAVANHPAGYTPQDQEKLESIAQFIAPILKIYIEKESAQQKAQSHADKLQERNIALKVLLETRDEEKQQQLDRVAGNFERLVLPYYEKMMRCRTVEEIQTLLAIVESNTHDCLAPIETGTPKLHRLLTPMEGQVADLIKAGKTSKEIAALLTISPRAVYFHRNNIRKKLDLRNTKANLRSLLNSYR
jgi:PAS domain S-box-containing protein